MSNSPADGPLDLTAIGPMSRRSLFRRGAGLAAIGVAPSLLAACGSDTSGTSSSNEIGGTIVYVGLQGEDYPATLKPFLQKNGIKFKSKYITSTGEVLAKFAAGGDPDTDILQMQASEIGIFLESGVELEPLDLERIDNWKNVERFVELSGSENWSNEKGEIICVPTDWGALGITYDSSVIEEPTAWAQLLEPELKGKLVAVDDVNANFSLAANILGFNPRELTPEQFEEVTDYLRRVLENCLTVSGSYGDIVNLFGSGEVAVMFCGWAAINLFAAEAGNPNLKTNIQPEEGSVAFAEGYSLPSGASNPAAVYAVMNEIIVPKVNAKAAASVSAAPVATGAQRYMPRSVASLYPTEATLGQYFETNAIATVPPVKSDKYATQEEMEQAWSQIKAGL